MTLVRTLDDVDVVDDVDRYRLVGPVYDGFAALVALLGTLWRTVTGP